MKKNVTKLLSMLLGFTVVATSVVACDKRGGDDGDSVNRPIDVNKTQFAIANDNGGLGDQWLRKVADNFEEFYKDVEFETGKKGVQVLIDNKAVGEVMGAGALNKLQGSRDAIYFTEGADYFEYATSGKVLDITDLINEPLTEYGENVAIIDKLDGYLVDNLKTRDNKYYMLPYYNGSFNISYDVKVFEDNGLYFKKGATTDDINVFAEDVDLESLFIINPDDERSVGPDNVANTLDDGLPVTYDDFFALCRYMKETYHLAPLVWTGVWIDYLCAYSASLWANEVGYDGLLRTYKMDGTADDLIDVAKDGTVTPLASTEIDETNGYLLQKEKGRYEVLKFIYNLVKDEDFYDAQSFGSSLSHTGAQDRFLYSSSASYDTIGMLIEGSWWWNEARGTFDSMAQSMSSNFSRQNRDMGILPPLRSTRATGTEAAKSTLFDMSSSYCMINASMEGVQLDIAKKFYRFMHTNESLQIFTQETGAVRGMKVDFTPEEKQALPYYAQSFLSLYENSDVIYEVSNTPKVANNYKKFDASSWAFSTIVDGDTYTNPFTTFKFQNVTPIAYFNGMKTFQQNSW